MKRSRFSEEQIIAILKEHEAGMPTADVCRRHGISSATFYKYKAKFGGLDVSEARRLRALEDENAKLKKLLAEAQSRAPDSVGRLLLVGHNPGMEDLVAILSGRREAFPTAALAVLEIGIDSWKALELGVSTRLVNVYRPKEID